MKFTPKSDKEIAEERLLPSGEYDFHISAAYDKTSQSGNEMIELLIRVYKNDGGFVLVNDYLMEKVLYKLSHAAKACGLEDRYQEGLLSADDFVDKTGRLKLSIQVDKTGDYPDKNVVRDYIIPVEKKLVLPSFSSDNNARSYLNNDLNDDIPF